MASKFGSHTRSISLPSRSHPATENLERLEASEPRFNLPKIDALEDFCLCSDDLLQLSVVQQAPANDRYDKCVQNLLEGSQMKESVQNFESTVRRKRAETSLANEIGNYIKSRKNTSKLVCKRKQGGKTAQNFLTKTVIFSLLLRF